MSLPILMPSILMGKHSHHPSDRPQPKKASQHAGTGGLLSKALGRRRGSRAPPPQQPAQRSEKPASVQPHDPSKPVQVRTRVPAVTSKARTTAPERDSRPNRRKYPSTMRQRLH